MKLEKRLRFETRKDDLGAQKYSRRIQIQKGLLQELKKTFKFKEVKHLVNEITIFKLGQFFTECLCSRPVVTATV